MESLKTNIGSIALAIAAGLLSPVAALAVAPTPANGIVLVVASDPAAVVTRANGRVLGPTTAPFAVLSTGSGDFADRAWDEGAWIVTSADWMSALCGTL